jgi:hypothetical protein
MFIGRHNHQPLSNYELRVFLSKVE